MSDRLAELLRQKKLLQEHLNWLDQEIANTASTALQGPPPSTALPHVAPPEPSPLQNPSPIAPVPQTVLPAPVTTASSGVAPSTTAVEIKPEAMRMADEIIARYQQEDALKPEDTKRGCLLLAGIVLLLMATAFLVSWWFFYRSHQ